MKVLVIGSGAREHSLVWKIAASPLVSRVYAAPGNAGTAASAENVPVAADDLEGLVRFASDAAVGLTVVGPDLPLALGVVDRFRAAGLRVFGPTAAAARLEGSKRFSKEVMAAAGIRTPAYEECRGGAGDLLRRAEARGAPVVLKADGLALGKGVVVCKTHDQIAPAVRYLTETVRAETVLVEEYVEGVEASFFVVTDGERYVRFPTSHDYKRVFDGNRGPNTGGMGAVSPTPYLTPSDEEDAERRVVVPLLAEMRRRGTPFSGFLYVSLMKPAGGGAPYVIEFNARYGDPECQPTMRRLTGDIVPLLSACAEEGRDGGPLPPPECSGRAAACVVLAAEGYPDRPRTGGIIFGLDEAAAVPGVVVFHAGTGRRPDGSLVATGGRVLSVTALADTQDEAVAAAYRAAALVTFDGVHYRRDVGGPNGAW